MARNPRRIDEQLAELYAQVPRMADCKGLCADSCGPIEASVRETQKIEKASGRTLEGCPINCSMLTPMGRCSQYELRPMICRIFGTTKRLRCEHGCSPERWLDEDEAWTLLLRSFAIGGTPEGIDIDHIEQVINSPKTLKFLSDYALAQRINSTTKKGIVHGLDP